MSVRDRADDEPVKGLITAESDLWTISSQNATAATQTMTYSKGYKSSDHNPCSSVQSGRNTGKGLTTNDTVDNQVALH